MERFWESKNISEMNDSEWESLCDGCGRCCLQKLQCEDSGEVFYTELACKLLDLNTCRCKDYPRRTEIVSECISLRQLDDEDWYFMPDTCAYRLLKESKPLYDWHPLIYGNQEQMLALGISVKGKVLSEIDVNENDFEEHVIQWVGS